MVVGRAATAVASSAKTALIVVKRMTELVEVTVEWTGSRLDGGCEYQMRELSRAGRCVAKSFKYDV
jgi:hypothetical protein